MKALGAKLGELRRGADGRQGLVSDLPAETQWAFDRDAEVTKRLVREDLDSVVLLEVAVKVGDLGDLLRADQLALFAEALAHLDPQFAGVDELNLAAACGALAIREDPEVGRDAGVVKELVRQSDDRLQPVVLDDPAPDLRLPRPCSSAEQRRAVEDDREARSALLHGLHLGDHVLQEQEAAVVDAWQARTEPTSEALGLVLVAHVPLDLLPLHPEWWVGEEVIEDLALEGVVRERVAQRDTGGVLALQHHVRTAHRKCLRIQLLPVDLELGVRVVLAQVVLSDR